MRKRVEVRHLRIGMFVAELDRPWLESPFLFQGFVIENEDELGKLQELCDYVFVDEARSRRASAPRAHFALFSSNTSTRTMPGVRRSSYTARFETAYTRTQLAHRETRHGVIKLLDDRRLGKLVSTESIRHSLSSLMASVLTDPCAALWLTRMRGEDEFSVAHSMNVTTLSLAFARHLGVPESELHAIGLGALLHDIGLTDKSAAITRQRQPLSSQDFAVLRKHPVDGVYSIRNATALDAITTDIVRWHHERVDGSGYPDGLEGEAIPRHVLIVAIADTYDAMVSDRPFRAGMPPAHALLEMHRHADTSFGKAMVQAFIQCIGVYPATSVVQLNTGAIGVVVASNEDARLLPLLLMVRDERGQAVQPAKLVDLSSVERKTGERWYIESVASPTQQIWDQVSSQSVEFKI